MDVYGKGKVPQGQDLQGISIAMTLIAKERFSKVKICMAKERRGLYRQGQDLQGISTVEFRKGKEKNIK